MGMFIRVKGKAAAEVEQLLVSRIPHHSCGMLGKLPSESFGSLLAESFPKAMSFASGDALTPATLRINADALRPQDIARIEQMPKAYAEACAHFRGPDQKRCAAALRKLARHYQVMGFSYITGRLVLRSGVMPFGEGVPTSMRVLRKVLRKDELRALLKVQSL